MGSIKTQGFIFLLLSNEIEDTFFDEFIHSDWMYLTQNQTSSPKYKLDSNG